MYDHARKLTARPVTMLAPLLFLYVALSFWFPEHPSDELSYLELARNLIHGEYTGLGWRPTSPFPSPDPANPDLWFGPGLPLVLTPLVAVDLPLDVVRLIGPLCLFLAVVVFLHLLRMYVRSGIAMLGAYALGLYFPFYVLLSNLHSEPLAILAIVAMLLFTARYVRAGKTTDGLLAGGTAGLVALTRVEYGWVVTTMMTLFAVAWLVSRRPALGRIALVYALGLTLCLPWLAFTYSVTGRAFLWGNSGSLSLYWMSSPYQQDLGDWRGGAHEVLISDPTLIHHRAFFEELSTLDPVEQNRRLEHVAFENIRGHPTKFARNVAANVSRMWFDLPFSEKPEELSALFYLLPNSFLLWGLVAAVLVLARRRSRLRAELVAFAAFGVTAFSLHAVLAAYPRMLMPLIPIVLFFVVYALGAAIRRTA